MPKYINNFVQDAETKEFGVLLVNLGTPKSPSARDVRQFLRRFLSDHRVVELPRLIWWFILNGIVLTIRPRKSAKAYRAIWQPEGSPLLVNSQRQAEKVQSELHSQGVSNAVVRVAMRYSDPSIVSAFDELTYRGISKLLIVPMYPQYSGSTTASIFDEIGKIASKRRYVPEVRFMNGYAARSEYIEALKQSVEHYWSMRGRADFLVMSFHGLPQQVCDDGDPYAQQCANTATLLAEALGITDWQMCFQSRVGPKDWLQPYTDHVLVDLPRRGIKRIDVLCPGFSVDCLETLEEVAMGYRDLFLESGGESYNYIPCLNADSRHVEMLTRFVRQSAADWIEHGR